MLETRLTTLGTAVSDLVPPSSNSSLAVALDAASVEPSEQLKVVLAIVDNGADLFADPTLGSRAFARFYLALRASHPELAPLLCAHCGRDRPLTMVFEQHRVCIPCYQKARHKPCGECGRVGAIVLRLPDGRGVCQACRKKLPDASATCISCGEHRIIGIRTPSGPLCPTCRFNDRIDECRSCGTRGPCRFAGTDRATCEMCRRIREACSRCGHHRLVSTRTAHGAPLCHSCTERPPEPCRECGKVARVVTRIGGEPICGTCYRNHPASFRNCPRCGSHRRIRQDGFCDHCTIVDFCDELFPTELLETSSPARALRDALVDGSEQRTVAAFLRPKSIAHLRTLLQSGTPITHDAIDALGGDPATMVLRSALIEYGVLEPVDIHLRRFRQWIHRSSTAVADVTVRAGYVQYATWKHLRELRAKPGPISSSLASSRRSELKIVLDLLAWAERRNVRFADLAQGHIDVWSLHGSERHRATGFLRWAHRNKLCPHLIVRPRRQNGPLLNGMGDAERAELLSRVLRTTQIDAGTKLAAALILLYGISAHRIVRIELSQISATGTLSTIHLGSETLHLPEELNLVAAAVAEARTAHRLLHSVEDSRWLFPGSRPGYPIASTTMRRRLYKFGFPVAEVRKGAIVALAATVHPVVLAELTGIHIRTAIWWRNAIATSRDRYVGAVLARNLFD